MFKKNVMSDDYDSQPNGLSLRKILSIIILLFVLSMIAGLLVYLKPLSEKKGAGVTEKKTEIMKRLELYEAGNNPLKPEEKEQIFETLADTKIQDYNFSKEEKIKLLKALNN